VIGRRLHLGRHLRVIAETVDDIRLEGDTRLRPGEVVELVSSTSGNGPLVRRACVVSWSVARLGNGGPTYTGECRWQ
jgi:hypothetical protein